MCGTLVTVNCGQVLVIKTARLRYHSPVSHLIGEVDRGDLERDWRCGETERDLDRE